MDPQKRNILEEAIRITSGERQSVYGPPEENFARIARIASALTGKDMTPSDCVMVQIATKFARLQQTPGHVDSKVDIAGYTWVLDRVVG